MNRSLDYSSEHDLARRSIETMSEAPTDFVPHAEPVWLAALRGDENVLRQLAAHLKSDELSLHTLGAEWVAYTRHLQACTSPRDFGDRVRSDLVPLLNWLARYVEPNGAGVHLDHVVRLRTDGTQDRVILGSMAAVEARGFAATINGEGCADRLVRLTWEQPEVMRVIRFRESPDRDLWSGLYRVMEGISEDVGGEPRIADHGWRSANWLELFRRTANTEAAGATGRHGHTKWAPPANPMTLADARRGIDEIFVRWIDWKLSKQ